jgi:DNA repair protein RadC
MTIQTAKRKQPGKTHRFIVTNVLSEACLSYSLNWDAIDTPEKSVQFWKKIIAKEPSHEQDKECLVVILLNARLKPFGWNIVSIGHVAETIIHPREVLRPCLLGAAYGFLIMHNHPSGNPSPSKSDEVVTRKMIEASTIMQIQLIDHIIIGKPSVGRSEYFSFREAGIIQ